MLERVDISFFRHLKRLIVIKVNLLQNFVTGLTDVLLQGIANVSSLGIWLSKHLKINAWTNNA